MSIIIKYEIGIIFNIIFFIRNSLKSFLICPMIVKGLDVGQKNDSSMTIYKQNTMKNNNTVFNWFLYGIITNISKILMTI